VTGCRIAIEAFGPDNWNEYVAAEIFEGTEGGTTSFIFEFPTTGEYFFEISNTAGPWSLTFNPR
jgi:hypothetical protein